MRKTTVIHLLRINETGKHSVTTTFGDGAKEDLHFLKWG